MSHIHNISPLTRSNSKYSKAIIKELSRFVITTRELSHTTNYYIIKNDLLNTTNLLNIYPVYVSINSLETYQYQDVNQRTMTFK